MELPLTVNSSSLRERVYINRNYLLTVRERESNETV